MNKRRVMVTREMYLYVDVETETDTEAIREALKVAKENEGSFESFQSRFKAEIIEG